VTTGQGLQKMRYDLQVLSSWIEPDSRVLDLGCGHGDLLYFLQREKGVQGVGFEEDEEKAASCISRGLSVLHENFNEDVLNYPAGYFDYCVLSQTLQQVYEPDRLILKLLEIGKKVIVSFPNFSHWRVRLQLLTTGIAPKNEHLPYEWYNTPNIRVITIKDFKKFICTINACILKEAALNSSRNERFGRIIHLLPDWRATYGIFLLKAETQAREISVNKKRQAK
jgi:methionine biosynthesis protein MetW